MKITQMCKLGLMSLVLAASSLLSPLSAYATNGSSGAPVVTNSACKPELALNIQVDPKSTLQDTKARVDFTGSLPNNHKCKAGDQLIVTIPKEVSLPNGKTFPLGLQNQVVAVGKVAGDKIVITLTDFVQKNKDIKLIGSLDIQLKITIQPGKEIKLEWNINGKVVFTFVKIELPTNTTETRVITWYTYRDSRDKEGTEKTGGIAHMYPQYLDLAKLNLKPCQDYVTQTDTMVGTKAELDAIINDGVLANDKEDAKVTKSWVVKFHKTDCEVYHPSIDIQKFDGDLATGDRDTTDEAKLLDHDKTQLVTVIIKNTGNETLEITDLADYTTHGDVQIDFACDFDKDAQLLLPGKEIRCQGELPAMGYEAVHGDTFIVEARGVNSKKEVSGEDPWYAYTNPKEETPVEPEVPVNPTAPANPTTPATPTNTVAKSLLPAELPQTGPSTNMPMWLPMVLSMAVYGIIYKFQRRAEEK